MYFKKYNACHVNNNWQPRHIRQSVAQKWGQETPERVARAARHWVTGLKLIGRKRPNLTSQASFFKVFLPRFGVAFIDTLKRRVPDTHIFPSLQSAIHGLKLSSLFHLLAVSIWSDFFERTQAQNIFHALVVSMGAARGVCKHETHSAVPFGSRWCREALGKRTSMIAGGPQSFHFPVHYHQPRTLRPRRPSAAHATEGGPIYCGWTWRGISCRSPTSLTKTSGWMDSPVASPSPPPSFSCVQQYPSPVPLTPSLGCSPSSTESLSGDHPDVHMSTFMDTNMFPLSHDVVTVSCGNKTSSNWRTHSSTPSSILLRPDRPMAFAVMPTSKTVQLPGLGHIPVPKCVAVVGCGRTSDPHPTNTPPWLICVCDYHARALGTYLVPESSVAQLGRLRCTCACPHPIRPTPPLPALKSSAARRPPRPTHPPRLALARAAPLPAPLPMPITPESPTLSTDSPRARAAAWRLDGYTAATPKDAVWSTYGKYHTHTAFFPHSTRAQMPEMAKWPKGDEIAEPADTEDVRVRVIPTVLHSRGTTLPNPTRKPRKGNKSMNCPIAQPFVPAVIQVNFLDQTNRGLAHRQVFVDEFPAAVSTAVNGTKKYMTLLSDLLPAAIENDSPIKGMINALLERMNEYNLVPLNDGSFACDVFWEKSSIANMSQSPEATDLEGTQAITAPLQFTGTGSDVPLVKAQSPICLIKGRIGAAASLRVNLSIAICYSRPLSTSFLAGDGVNQGGITAAPSLPFDAKHGVANSETRITTDT
ncbi:hypothetical protein B0H14DRAFT_2575826 [Mycena olivaceomarginata]|nr:hypothetical protein B0H14DRAFT_2575826 [Mycena olivaceomarginata]